MAHGMVMRNRFNRSGERLVQSHLGRAGPNALQSVLLACLLLSTSWSCLAAVSAWSRWEQTLTSTFAYTNPGVVTVGVAYTGPNQRTLNGLAFCEGSNSFRIRCLFPEPGQWT